MAKKTVKINRNSDNTLTIRVGRDVEHISLDGKTKGEVFDYVKWAVVSKDVSMSDVSITEILMEAINA